MSCLLNDPLLRTIVYTSVIASEMSGRQRLDHRQILYGRYCDILKSLDLDALAAHLTEIGLLTQQERDDIVSTPHSDRKKVFSKILTSREVKRFSEISSSIKQFRLGATAGVKGGNDVKKVSSSNKDVETNSTVSVLCALTPVCMDMA